MTFSKKIALLLLPISILLIGCSKESLPKSFSFQSPWFSGSGGWVVGHIPEDPMNGPAHIEILCPIKSFSGFAEAVNKIPEDVWSLRITLSSRCKSSDWDYLWAMKILAEKHNRYQGWSFSLDGPGDKRLPSTEELNVLKNAQSEIIGLWDGFSSWSYNQNIAKTLRSGKPTKYWEPMGILYSEEEKMNCLESVWKKSFSENVSQEELEWIRNCLRDLDEI